MIGAHSVLAIIPARGGSKGVPRKNIRRIAGRALIDWTIAAAFDSNLVDRVVVSSDDDEICNLASEYGSNVPLKRPANLATDDATSLAVVLHVLETVGDFDIGVLLQPTSPLRTASDIDACLCTMEQSRAQSCVSVYEVSESPYWMYTLSESGQMKRLLPDSQSYSRRQDLPAVYMLNGALYAFRASWLRTSGRFVDCETVGYVMPQSRSLDIDTEDDMAAFSRVIEQRK